MSAIAIKTTEGQSTVKSGSLIAEEHEILYVVSGARSRAEAFAAVDSAAPSNVDELVKKQLRFEKFTGNDMEISAIYGKAIEDSEDPGVLSSLVSAKAKVSFDTSGGTQHIVSSKGTTKYNPEGGGVSYPVFSIGWNGKLDQDAEYAGVDIVVPNTRKIVTQTIRKPTTAYENIVIDLTGTVNSVKFLGREPGEVLFLGASWSDEGGSSVPATYNFAIRRNETTTVDGIPNVEKKGWEYIWNIINLKKVTVDGIPEPTVKAVYVSKVYEETDFRLLGIRV